MAQTLLYKYLNMVRGLGVPADQIANFRAAGYAPQAKQAQFHALARAADDPSGPNEISIGGARGGGKTFGVFNQVAVDDCQRIPGLKGLMLRKIGKAVQETVEDLRQTALRHVPHDYKRGERVLNFPNGSRIVLGNFKDEKDIDSYLGLEYDVIVVEEATTLTYSKYKAIRTCLRTSKPNWRPRVYLSTNPGGIGHFWFKKRFIRPFKADEETTTRFIPSTVYDNLYINEGYRAVLEDLTGWLKQAWLFGNWDINAGQYFTTWNESIHVKPWFKIPENWRSWLAYDYGFHHNTVVYLCTEDPETKTFWLVDEHHASQMLVPHHAMAVAKMLKRHDLERKDIYEFVAGADVFAKRDDIGEYSVAELWEKEGFRLTKANQDRVNGAAEMLLRLGDPTNEERPIEPRFYVTERCPLFIETVPILVHDPHRPEDVMKMDMDEDGEGGDDAYDGARYGLMAQAAASSRRLTSSGNPFYS